VHLVGSYYKNMNS